ncbi:MAG: thiamine-phosphate kinase [bacterium]
MELRELGEFGLIARIKGKLPPPAPGVLKGIGDDAAICSLGKDKALVSTVDLLVEGIHFDLSYTPPYFLGRKSLAVNLSDLAAMGAKPLYALISIALPTRLNVNFIDEFISGFLEVAKESRVSLIGGDTSASPDKLFISVTLLGEGAKEKLIYRQGAAVGDDIYITGTLGDSLWGMKILQQQKKEPFSEAESFLVGRHLNPTARVKEGQIIAQRNLAHAMIDVSDGLLSDLGHICTESKVGATIWAEEIPLSSALKILAKDKGEPPWKIALLGGEDYELLFTAPAEKAAEIEELNKEWDCGVTQIGKIEILAHGLVVKDAHGVIDISKYQGYEHFAESFPLPFEPSPR